jgi:tripartite-type tricarboxylate transporter receptor subunit TctC
MEKNVLQGQILWNAEGGKATRESKPAGRDQAAQRPLMTAGAIVGAILLIGAMVAPLCAQSYPNKPIRLIVPMVGGTVDVLGRIIAQKLAEQLGQPVVVENRGGAGGNIGTEVVANARPDGYTILLCHPSLTISPSLYNKLNYDPIKDFAPISMVAEMPYAFLTLPSAPFKNLKELVEYAKANPRKLNFGSAGIGSVGHLTLELLKSLAKIDIVHVPYKGGAGMMVGLMGGEVDIVNIGVPGAWSQIQAGKIRALAVFSKKRALSLPNVPTAIEAGYDDLVMPGWYGLLAPAGTPRDIVNRLHSDWVKIAAMSDTKELMQKAGFEAVSDTPEQFSEFIKAETGRCGKIIKEANITKID